MRTFVELVERYINPEFCPYPEYKGKPYYSIKYIEKGEEYVGYSTYSLQVMSEFLKKYFISPALEKQERETQEKPFPLIVGQPAEMFVDGKWEKGKIVAGYRFNDGVVTIETEDGRRLWCGQDRTDIYRPYQEEES